MAKLKIPAWMGRSPAYGGGYNPAGKPAPVTQGQAMGADGNVRMQGAIPRRYIDPAARMQPNIQGNAAMSEQARYAAGSAAMANYYNNPRTYSTGPNERREYITPAGKLVRLAPNSQLTINGNRPVKQNPIPKWINRFMGGSDDGNVQHW
ncbi:MAG: hypothetical protein KC496_23015 [Anaerolineae bacterium]|nr:hypothetical protein [Anaerolineae bacterium]